MWLGWSIYLLGGAAWLPGAADSVSTPPVS